MPNSSDPIDCSPPGSSVHGNFQASTLEWVAMSFSMGSSWPRNQTRVSSTTGRFFTDWVTRILADIINVMKEPWLWKLPLGSFRENHIWNKLKQEKVQLCQRNKERILCTPSATASILLNCAAALPSHSSFLSDHLPFPVSHDMLLLSPLSQVWVTKSITNLWQMFLWPRWLILPFLLWVSGWRITILFSILQICFFNHFYYSVVNSQHCVSFKCTAKWISCTYTCSHSFLDSFPITVFAKYWVELSVLHCSSY